MTIIDALRGVKQAGDNKWIALCPAHDDRSPSLSVRCDDGTWLLNCHTGCDTGDILQALGVGWDSVFPARELSRVPEAVYPYREADGTLRYEKCRFPGKDFRFRRANGKWGLGGERQIPYRLNELRRGIEAGHTVFVVEGEKACDRLRAEGFIVTCFGGSEGWRPEYAQHFQDAKRVVLFPDKDDPGRRLMDRVARDLASVTSVQIIELAGLPEHGDIHDWLAAGYTGEQLKAYVEDVPVWVDPSLPASGTEFLTRPRPPERFLVPGLLVEQDKILWTGPEGHGKSTLLWQFAICGAAGLHPFTGEKIEPFRSLIVDLENREVHLANEFARFHQAAGSPEGWYAESRPQGLWLTEPDDRAWLESAIRGIKPDLVCLGPLNKTHDDDDRKQAKEIAWWIDKMRDEHNVAFLIETHMPLDNQGIRQYRPKGAQLWVGWPEQGYALKPQGQGEYTIEVFRFCRGEREWPERIKRFGAYPHRWEAV